MILVINALEDADHRAAIAERIAMLEWRDGRETAGSVARQVKRNEQAAMNSPAGRALQDELSQLVSDNIVVKAAAQPRRFSPVIISRTGVGGKYGAHVDNALMGRGAQRLRTDLSFTLFLTPPGEYEGGELVIHAAGMTQELKGEAGNLVLYPSGSIHEVKPVTKGTRIVCIGWIESTVADPAQREMLFDLENLRTALRQQLPAQSAELLTLDKTIANLLRMWARS
ncbi:PKHD-type hydroxylase [Erythromicrobium ramosum]|jgi:PKHD-type hydroxylase|uniref:Fe2+-dependent dioxygenase n=1 Tax=Erythrobacter ramosus TaxID=35811 RepID=A0A6I4UEX8_9SPHN|nr:Fe2+-dependent dioxygenase [Erythrobacter ramosus]MBB3775340.1 PKHD-type hydroxylase [Erythrobacter ramosus]MXP37038.1 Fe2+-dependent dioxygenase [Erythrobacter ramosus]